MNELCRVHRPTALIGDDTSFALVVMELSCHGIKGKFRGNLLILPIIFRMRVMICEGVLVYPNLGILFYNGIFGFR
jgi:hypothetical protein